MFLKKPPESVRRALENVRKKAKKAKVAPSGSSQNRRKIKIQTVK